MEIERKFLVSELPSDLSKYQKKEMTQGYISVDPELRIRSSGSKYIFTFKNSGSLVREEFESDLTLEQYENLRQLITGNEIVKTRYKIPLENELVAELDIYGGRLNGLTTVEVEFASIEQSKLFNPPNWFGDDVTEDRRYGNSSLSKKLPPNFS